jgi:hypothetical protein
MSVSSCCLHLNHNHNQRIPLFSSVPRTLQTVGLIQCIYNKLKNKLLTSDYNLLSYHDLKGYEGDRVGHRLITRSTVVSAPFTVASGRDMQPQPSSATMMIKKTKRIILLMFVSQ